MSPSIDDISHIPSELFVELSSNTCAVFPSLIGGGLGAIRINYPTRNPKPNAEHQLELGLVHPALTNPEQSITPSFSPSDLALFLPGFTIGRTYQSVIRCPGSKNSISLGHRCRPDDQLHGQFPYLRHDLLERSTPTVTLGANTSSLAIRN